MVAINYDFPGTYCLNNGPQDVQEAFSILKAHFKGSSNRANANRFQLKRETTLFGDEYITVTENFGGREYGVFRFSKINYPFTGHFRGRESDYQMESSSWGSSYYDPTAYNPTLCESLEGIPRSVIHSFATLFNVSLTETMPDGNWHFTGRD